MNPIHFIVFPIVATTLSAGCAYHIYSPTQHSRQIEQKEHIARRIENRANSLEAENASLRSQRSRLRSKIQGVKAEIANLQKVPNAPDSSATQKRIEYLLNEQAVLQEKLNKVQGEIHELEKEQQQLRNEAI